ncbi:MAG: hypothetical protein ABI882_24225, partial [Acidobacteriota bacterium]
PSVAPPIKWASIVTHLIAMESRRPTGRREDETGNSDAALRATPTARSIKPFRKDFTATQTDAPSGDSGKPETESCDAYSTRLGVTHL